MHLTTLTAGNRHVIRTVGLLSFPLPVILYDFSQASPSVPPQGVFEHPNYDVPTRHPADLIVHSRLSVAPFESKPTAQLNPTRLS